MLSVMHFAIGVNPHHMVLTFMFTLLMLNGVLYAAYLGITLSR